MKYHRLLFAAALLFPLLISRSIPAKEVFPSAWPGVWQADGRCQFECQSNSALITGGFLANDQKLGDFEISFDAQAPASAGQVQIWAGFHCENRDSRYVFGLRGGNDNDVYIARYAPDGGAKFLGFAPLDFKPVPGVSYHLRVMAVGDRFQIYLNNESLPRLNVEDREAYWHQGGICLGGGWLPVNFSNLQVKEISADAKTAFLAVKAQVWTPPAVDKEAIRKQQRAAYEPVKVAGLAPERSTVGLDGNWLFLPDFQLTGPVPVAVDYDDSAWHVMPVPEFWTPGLSWLHGETSFSELSGFSVTKGEADSLYVAEARRVGGYTFDSKRTKAAWYRQYLELPADLAGRRFELNFDAIAKVSEVWVNGKSVASHVGMFGKVACDVTDALKPGRNVIAVHVTSEQNSNATISNKVEGVAVTVEVTSRMLHSLPHGMFEDDVGGIWQPVNLTVTAPVAVSDCFIEPGLHGADVQLEVLNAGGQPASVEVNYSIIACNDHSLLFSNATPVALNIAAGTNGSLKITTPELNPRLWSPQEPNLYYLEIQLSEQGKIVDQYETRFGFRTFVVKGAEFLLNGHPYWLRGANPFPSTLRPNDAELATKFMKLARAGNVRMTRSHIVPFSATWLDAADENGMGVSFEGTWPWLMLSGEPPSPDLLAIWKEEFLSLMHEHRNHPSLLLWTVNNEMKFPVLEKNPDWLKQKWFILDDMIKAMRQADPTRPIVADSSYVRKQANRSYQSVAVPNHLDDGDVDDDHSYFGWYNPSFFHFFNGEYGNRATPGRPLISQEMSTGYPNNDEGHPARYYLFKHYTPQALVGNDAYENADPAIFLTRQAFMTKELAEAFRRMNRDVLEGILHFSYTTWFTTPWSVEHIKPQTPYYALQTALQPVLVSAELYGRHFYAGATVHRRVCIINDAENYESLPASTLVWEVKQGEHVLSTGTVPVASVGYFQNQWLDVDFAMPADVPAGRADAQLVLTLKAGDQVVSTNNYDIVVASKSWADDGAGKNPALVYLTGKNHSAATLLNASFSEQPAISSVDPAKILVIEDLKTVLDETNAAQELNEFVNRGGNVLLLHPSNSLKALAPDAVKSFATKEGEIATMDVPESPVFSGIAPLDLSWFERGERRLPLACTGVYQVNRANPNIQSLAAELDIHAYLQRTTEVANMGGTPLLEIRLGKGRIVASEMNLEAGKDDPIALRLLGNIVGYLQTPPAAGSN